MKTREPARAEPLGRYALLKRSLDIAGAGCGLVLTAPLLLVVSALVRFTLGSPAIFRQTRPGLHGRPFVMYKFRTMKVLRSAGGEPLPDHQRLTRLGRLLRVTSLDELPELVNVLRGDMSLVGPRPLLMEYLELYTPEQARRHEVKPGITGWAQVNGRNAITWEEKFAHDVWYVQHVSFWVDLWILAKTFKKLLTREGVSQPGHATVEYYTGRGA
jgi:sugar transferase EpsL